MTKEEIVIEYIRCKIKQHAASVDFKLTSENKEKFKKTIKPKLKEWIEEACEISEALIGK